MSSIMELKCKFKNALNNKSAIVFVVATKHNIRTCNYTSREKNNEILCDKSINWQKTKEDYQLIEVTIDNDLLKFIYISERVDNWISLDKYLSLNYLKME